MECLAMASSSDESLHLGFFEDAANTTTPDEHHEDSPDLPIHSEETESLPGDPQRDVLSPSTPPPSDVAGSRTSDTYPVMKAIANVRPRNANELRLKKDDLLEILMQYDADWLVVKLIANQRLGMVKLCNVAPATPAEQRCPVERYYGSFLQMCSWPLTLKEVLVSVGNAEDYLRLQQEVSVGRLQGIQYLSLCLPHQQLIASEVTESLPNIKNENGNEATDIYLPDLDAPTDVAGVVGLVKALMPHPGKLGFLTFPRCSLTLQDILCLTQQLALSNIKVRNFLCFPSDEAREKRRRDLQLQHPGNSPQEIKTEIMKIAKEQIGALRGVLWGNVPSLNAWTDSW